MIKIQQHYNGTYLKILFRIWCLVMSLVFLPDLTLAACSDDHQTEQMANENLPENSEKEPCNNTSGECEEDSSDSFLHSHDLLGSELRLAMAGAGLNKCPGIRERVKEILAPPPRQS